ncbi:MAG: hypothetical protein RLZZ292_3132, partial [Bacteroidota bacterium]
MKINIFLFLFLSFYLFSTKAVAQQTMTLEEAIKYATEHSIGLRNSQLGITDAEAQIKERRATGLPQVSADLSWQSFFKKPQVVFPASFGNGTLYAVYGILAQEGVKNGTGGAITVT